ncbi:MAG: flagellar basal body rod protein FlgC [Armatimonadetes bacterium]|jgi:flagellar basal-body rod protein FlgC|nr:flagellar basal body rod protein FlgC [Armatimonadota bacterium]
MRLFASLEISSAGLAAQRTRLDTIATNIANAETTRTPEGGPYQRKRVVFREVLNQGVAVAGTVTDPTPGPRIYEPGHPDADAAGYVQMPNVQLPTEMVEMVSATRSYEANAAAVAAAKRMALKALEIGE